MGTQPGDLGAAALWYVAPGKVELRSAQVPARAPGEVLVRALWSGVSRGTERLVSQGQVPEGEWARMRCLRQEGDFPFPVKYGYSLVGRVEAGSDDLAGRAIFALNPHQTLAVLSGQDVLPLPDGLPPRRAVLAANMETALNAMWDAEVGPGDRVAVVGGGVVGCLVAYLAARIPGCAVTLVDVNPDREKQAQALGAGFAVPSAAPRDCDVVFHTSASEAGFATALSCAGLEATLCEMSWYGDRRISVGLGEAFHSRRIRLISSQVSMLPAVRRARWTHRRRLALALTLLTDDRLDVLLTHEIAFDDLPRSLPALFTDPSVLAIIVHYPESQEKNAS
jgi:threonine dehydrogenase-like Zn-dependent dehydrogenase